jgi:hypothetical protein
MPAGGDARVQQFLSFAEGFYEWQKAGKTNCFGAYTSPDLIVILSFTPSHSKPGTSVAPPLTPRDPAQNPGLPWQVDCSALGRLHPPKH